MAAMFSRKYVKNARKPGGFAIDNHIEAVLIMEGSSVLDEIAAAQDSGDFTDIKIMDGDNYVDKPVYFDVVEGAGEDPLVSWISKNSGLAAAVNQIVWTALGVSTDDVIGVLYRTTGSHAFPDTPIMFVEFAEPKVANGEDFKLNLDPSGVVDEKVAA